MSAMMNTVAHPSRLCWWQWGKLVGLCLPILFCGLNLEHPLLWAFAAHFFTDFTLQSRQTAIGKANGDWRVLAYHAFICGGYAGFVVGGLAGLAISVALHFLIDRANKFGLAEPAGPALDQALHLFTLVIIWWLW